MDGQKLLIESSRILQEGCSSCYHSDERYIKIQSMIVYDVRYEPQNVSTLFQLGNYSPVELFFSLTSSFMWQQEYDQFNPPFILEFVRLSDCHKLLTYCTFLRVGSFNKPEFHELQPRWTRQNYFMLRALTAPSQPRVFDTS